MAAPSPKALNVPRILQSAPLTPTHGLKALDLAPGP